MTEQKFIRELLSTGIGTEGTLLIVKKIHDTMILEVQKYLIPRTEAALVIGPSSEWGTTYTFNLEAENIMKVRAIAEGAEIILDQDEYSSVTATPVKYGVGIRITSEMMEDAKFNMLDLNVAKAAKRMGENENSLIITALDGAGTTVSGGSATTIQNITSAMLNVENKDYRPSTMIVGFEALSDLRNIDTFVEANKVGNTEMLQKGFLGTIYGLNVIRSSTNAGMTTTTSYIFDREQAYAIVEKRPLTVERFKLETYDMEGVTTTQRIAVVLLRSNAVSKITTS